MINTNGDLEAEPEVYLIDFGFSSKYFEEDGKTHIDIGLQTEMFEGNLLFASLDQMNFQRTSRRDDIISVFYLIIYLINDCQFTNLNINEKLPIAQQFKQVKDYKSKNSLTKLVEKLDIECLEDTEHNMV